MLNSRSDKFHEECGVVAIWGNSEASTLAYLGLHALQHRGQESAGIASSDGERILLYKDMGLVADIFNDETLARVPGRLAIGHTRYSTTGDSALLNAQPIRVECNKGRIALAHNGNLVNAADIRKRFERQGSIFQTTSDSEIILHLIAHSTEQTLVDAISDALRRIEIALEQTGAALTDVVRTRIYVTDISRWHEVGAVHAQVFGALRPAATMVEVSALITPDLLVEIEADAYVES